MARPSGSRTRWSARFPKIIARGSRPDGARCTRASARPRKPQRIRHEEDPMKIIDGLLAELDQEAQTTRRVLERIPQASLSWRPHPKSMSLGQLALHVATVPGNVAELAAKDTIAEPPNFAQAEASTASELVPALSESVARARRALG